MTFGSIFDIFRSMRDTLESAGTSAGLSGLFLAGLLALWYAKDRVSEKIRFMFIYATVILVVIIMPFYTGGCEKFLPTFTDLGSHLWLLPVTLVFMGTIYLISGGIKKSKNNFRLMLAFWAIMFLAGATAYTERSFISVDAEQMNIEGETYLAYEMVQRYISDTGDTDVLLLSSEDVMETVRRHDISIKTLYGRDMAESNKRSGYGVIYSEEQKKVYEVMHGEECDIYCITEAADNCDVTLIVLNKNDFITDPEDEAMIGHVAGEGTENELPDLSGYGIYSENESYICYAKEEKCNG